jgi:tetratricopeptide (TPR) repeat protein
MKNFCVIFLYISILTVTNESTYGQAINNLQAADSFYMNKNWVTAKKIYVKYLGDTSKNSMIWNRLGFCNQNLGLYSEAIGDYKNSLANNPNPLVKGSAMSRMAMAYSIMNQTGESTDWLLKATATGYNALHDLDSLDAFKNLRSASNFNDIRLKVYETVYPCSREPRNHDFDFWIGDWNCYRTGTQILSGSSHVEAMAGGCAILENYTATQAYSGKSFNFYDTIRGKWEQDWIGSGGLVDRQRYYNGEYKNGAMHFNYEVTNTNGSNTKGTFIFYNISKDSVRQYQDVTDDNGKIISVTYDLTYVRKN